MYNHVELFRAVARELPDEECFVYRNRRLTFRQLDQRVNQVAHLLVGLGLGRQRPRRDLNDWESGQDHVGLLLRNGNEYLEGLFGAAAAAAVSFNINYRYQASELAYLLNDASARVLIYHAEFAPVVAAALRDCHARPILMQVADDTGQDLLPGALDYEKELAAQPTSSPDIPLSPEDLYILYTGGTTGMPKGTLWSQGALYANVFADPGLDPAAPPSPTEIAKAVAASPRNIYMPLPPFMHGGSQWNAMKALFTGGKVVVPDTVERLDPHDVWTVAVREGVEVLLLVGDAFARPLCEELERSGRELPPLVYIVTGGAAMTPETKKRLLSHFPSALVIDGAGSSESGSQLSQFSGEVAAEAPPTFIPGPGTFVLDEALETVLEPGHDGLGWLARAEPIPFGYLGDPDKTSTTFRKVGGHRLCVPGDRVRLLSDGTIELLGRDSASINSGGEKIFVEEVEQALKAHPEVADALVVGRPSDRWGHEVVAVVAIAIANPETVTDADLIEVAGRTLARYKLPKEIVRVDEIRRGPSGKPDYPWAEELVRASRSARTQGSVATTISERITSS